MITDFKEVEDKNLPHEVISNEYLNSFAQVLMQLSNRLSEVEEGDFRDDEDLLEYLPEIRQYILNITGL